MFISQRAHDQVVALYEARLEEQRRHYEARLEHLQGEVVFYRNAWLERLGVKFPIPKPAEVTAVSPSAPVTVPSELELRKTFVLDRREWTVDDTQFYEDYWAGPKLKDGVPREELEYWYFQQYGSQLPMQAFLDAAYPVS